MRRAQKPSLHMAIRGPDRRQAFRRRTHLCRNHRVTGVSVVGMPRIRCGRKARQCQHQNPKSTSAHVPASPMSPVTRLRQSRAAGPIVTSPNDGQRTAVPNQGAEAETAVPRSGPNRNRTGQARGLTGSALSISARSAGISWPEPAARAEPVAVAGLAGAAAAPDGRPGAAAEGAEPDAAAEVAVGPRGAAAGPEPAASAEGAERAWQRPRQAWRAPLRAWAVLRDWTVAAEASPVFASPPELPAFPRGPGPRSQASAGRPEPAASQLPVLSEHPAPPEPASPEPVSRSGSVRREQAPWRREALVGFPWRRGPAAHWPSARRWE